MKRFCKRYRVAVTLLAAFLLCSVIVGPALAYRYTRNDNPYATGKPKKVKLPRDDVYYDIQNDVGDHGNFWESYHVPLPDGRTVYCVVYSDQIGDGGGGGPSCDWDHAK